MNMSISQRTSILLDTLETEPIPKTTIEFFCRTNQNRYHSMLLGLLKESGLTQKKVADKLGLDQGQINRWLSSASNLTINTVTKLMLAMGVDLDDPTYTTFDELRTENEVKSGAARAEPAGLSPMLHKGTSTGLTIDVLNQLIETLKRIEELPAPGASPASAILADGNIGGTTDEVQRTQPKPVREKVVSMQRWPKGEALGADNRTLIKKAS
jgi:transcriptional regulator with XRE-family HTH domain